MNDKIYVAKLGKTVGLEGFLKLHLDTDFTNQFKKGSKFFTNKGISLVIKSYNEKRNIVKFEDYSTIDEAKKLVNQELYVSIETTKETCVLEEGQYFWFDLITCKICDDENLILGEVIDIQRLPLSDYFEVKTSQELIEKGLPKIFLIPYLEMYIKSVDLEQKIIYTKDCLAILENS